jgi:hypothetical protein
VTTAAAIAITNKTGRNAASNTQVRTRATVSSGGIATIGVVDLSSTGRLEAFSDGVFSIAATLLVLEFSVSSGRDLGSQLTGLWPSYLAYATSFLTIGIIWMNHHYCVETMGRPDRTLLFLNLLLLMTVAFLPFRRGSWPTISASPTRASRSTRTRRRSR